MNSADAGAGFDRWITEQTGGLGLITADVQYLAGYHAGHAEGYQAGWDADHEAGFMAGWRAGWDGYGVKVQEWLGIVDNGLRLPFQDDLERARQFTNEPCSRGARNLATSSKLDCDCSRCTRYMVAWINNRDFGQPDYPGAEQAAQLRQRAAS